MKSALAINQRHLFFKKNGYLNVYKGAMNKLIIL